MPPTEKERRQIIGRVAEIGTRVVFENIYHQHGGGPIGARVTMCAAKMVIQNWARKYEGILLRAGLRVPLMSGYVDDGRQGSTVLRKGMMFDDQLGEFVSNEEQYERDVEEDAPDNIICLPAMNSVNDDLKFTTEAPEEFSRKRLPTLDFVIWMVNGILYHSYYEKPMKLQ